MVAAEFIRKSEVRVEKKASVVENPSAATKSSLKDLFFKTKMCSSVKNGKPCLDSEECRYAHSDAELRPLPDLSKTVLCKQMEKTGVCTFPHCTFAHSRLELRNSTVSQFKVKLCNFYPKGKCIDGENCRFAHSVNELGELVKVRNPASPKPGTNVDSQDKGRVSTTDGGDASLSPSAQTVASSASISTPLSPSSKPLIMSAFSTSSSLEKNPNTLSSTNQQHHFHTIHHHHNQYLINNPHIVGQSNFDPIPFTANMNAPSPAHSSSLTNPSLNAYSSSLPCDSFQRPHLSSSKDASLSINLPPHPLYPPHLQQHQPQHYRHVYCPPPPSSPLDLFNSSPTGVDPSTAFSHHARYSHGTNSNNNNNNMNVALNVAFHHPTTTTSGGYSQVGSSLGPSSLNAYQHPFECLASPYFHYMESSNVVEHSSLFNNANSPPHLLANGYNHRVGAAAGASPTSVAAAVLPGSSSLQQQGRDSTLSSTPLSNASVSPSSLFIAAADEDDCNNLPVAKTEGETAGAVTSVCIRGGAALSATATRLTSLLNTCPINKAAAGSIEESTTTTAQLSSTNSSHNSSSSSAFSSALNNHNGNLSVPTGGKEVDFVRLGTSSGLGDSQFFGDIERLLDTLDA